ncbi:MAG: hypothetical protein NTV22_18785 [bacterium]|nr:hypothetical protein [bacterium]
MNRNHLSTCKRVSVMLAVSAIAVIVGVSLLACCNKAANVTTFVQEYQRGLVALCNPQLDVVRCAVTNTGSAGYACTIQCRDRVTTTAVTLQFTLLCNELGLIESIRADHPLALGQDQPSAPGAVIPIETVMYAVAGTRAPPAESFDLVVKSAKARLSYAKPDFYKAASLAQLRAKCPTTRTTFDEISQFSFSLFASTDSFQYVIKRSAGVISGKKRNKFKYQPSSQYGTTSSPPVGLFLATLNKETLSLLYRHKQDNRDGLLMPSNIFASIHNSTNTNKPVRGVGFGTVTFNIDGDQHTSSNVPVLLKLTRGSLGISKVKLPKRRPKSTQ